MNAGRLIGVAAVIAVAAGAALVAGSLSSSTPSAVAGSGSSGDGSGGSGASAGTATTAPRCRAGALTAWVGVGPGGAATGSTYYPLELTNVSSRTCSLYGYPGVSARSEAQLGSAAGRSSAVAKHTVTLGAGATAHAVVQVVDVGTFPPSACAPATARDLRVYPPGSREALDVPFRLRACSKPGPVYLTVTPVEPHVGIPGRP